jgi:amidohydrolase
VGHISYALGTSNASSDEFRITVRGRQTHAAFPWAGVDPIVVGAQIISVLQTIASREANIVRSPLVFSVGTFKAGNRSNIISDRAEMTGTLRMFDDDGRDRVKRRVKEIAEGVAASMDATAEVVWSPSGVPILENSIALAERMAPSLARVAGAENLRIGSRTTGYDDFAYFSRDIPGLYFRIGITSPGVKPATAAPSHSPFF